MVTTTSSPLRAASATGTAVAPVSAARSASVPGPRELATRASCPSARRRRVRVPPIRPAPMMPILTSASQVHVRPFAAALGRERAVGRPPPAGSASGPRPRRAPPAHPDPAPRPARRPPPSAAARAAPGVPRSTTARHPSHRQTERLVPSRGGRVGVARRFRLEQAVRQQALTRKFRRSPVQPPSAAGASLTRAVHSRPGLRSVVRRLRPGRLLAPASRRRFALHDGWTTRISPRGAAARWSRALPALQPPPPGAIGGGPLHVAAHERVVTHLLAHHRQRVPRRELRQPTRRTHAIRARPSGRARPRRPRRPTLSAPCHGRPARPRGTARSVPDLQASLLAPDLGLAVH